MRKKVGPVDPAVELAARAIQSQPWDLSHWWKVLVFAAVRAKHECCFRDWSEPYPGPVGDRNDFICGECNQRAPIERVRNPFTGAEETREASDLGFCPHDPFCTGERLKPVSCASVFADHVNEFCDELERALLPDRKGKISWEKAHEAYWAFTHFKKHLPDWDPTGAYDGAFERWEAECATENLPAWGPEGPPELVPLIDRIQQERIEALTGAQRAYTKVMAPAERAFAQAIAEAGRIRGEAELALYRNQSEEIRRWLSGPHKVDRVLMAETAETWAAQRAAQEQSNREYRERYPSLSSRRPRRASDSGRQPAPQPPPTDTAALPDEMVALIHLKAAIRRPYEKAMAGAFRVYDRAVARAERAYQKAMDAPELTRPQRTREEKDWDTLTRLAERLTEVGKRVDQSIGRFFVSDVTLSQDEVIRHKERLKEELGLPKRFPPPPPASGPRMPQLADWVRGASAQGRSAKQIHAILKDRALKQGIKAPHISTIYRWIGPRRR
ncbi:MAG TPA: hypothetical protein VM537_26100 [Anaerolineae bacterium]|nr:hypothetical protein [Anaerolineae bacterium]